VPLVVIAVASAATACSHVREATVPGTTVQQTGPTSSAVAGSVGSSTVTMTTIAAAGSCGHFVTTVRTNESSYAPRQTVIISVTQTNEGPTCHGLPPQWCGHLQAFASVYNWAGEDIWDYGASKTTPGQITCPYTAAPGPSWPAHYSNTQNLDWTQGACARDETGDPGERNPNCPGTQAPAGTYRIVGNGTSAPITITITS